MVQVQEVKIRALTAGDTRVLARIVKKLISDCGEKWIAKLIPAPDPDEDRQEVKKDEAEVGAEIFQVFSTIITSIMDNYEPEITEWFASLCEISVEDYLRSPPNIDSHVVMLISEDEGFRDFLSTAWAAARRSRLLSGIIASLKTLFVFTPEEQPEG
ncbi:MAG: hypothetical protein KJN62_00295 [Deltaproteobacteria bacterium]|nr:hypothetical protein [Deltaproteobacteria bacterium]